MAAGLPDAIGRYEVLERIGHGGMGTLYRARDPRIGRDVAVKLLREGLDDGDTRERFAREARSAGQLKHGNIVTIFEFGDYNGQPFIAMEYIQGETLAAFLQRRPVVSIVRKLEIMDQLCAGLHYAHRMGVIHRDIKPANIMIDEDGVVKILDFGIARMGPSNMTQAGVLMGTLNYMAPEQMEGKLIDERADMFSAGAVFYEILAYRHAFPGDARGVMFKILHGAPEPLDAVCPGIDADLVAIINRCMTKQPEDRYPDLAVVKKELAAVRRRLERERQNDPDVTVVGVYPSGTGGPSSSPAQTGRPSSKESSRSVKWVQIRTDQIQAHINEARQAFESGDYEATLSACGKALVLDPENAEALELEERTRTSLEQQCLNNARGDLERGALTSAALLVDQVLAANPDSPDAALIRQAVEAARARLAASQAEALELEQRREAERAERERAEAERLRGEQVEEEKARQAAEAHARAQREFEERRAAAAAGAAAGAGDTIVAQHPGPPPVPQNRRGPPPTAPSGAAQRTATTSRTRPPNVLMFGGAAAALAAIVAGGILWKRAGRETPPPQVEEPRQEPTTPANPPSTPSNDEVRRQRLADARALLDRADFDGAIAEADRMLSENPGDQDARDLRAKAGDMKAIALAAAQSVPAPATAPPGRDRNAPPVNPAIQQNPVKPAPTPPAEPQGRNPSEGQGRERDLADRYARAKSALDSGAFSSAIAQFEALRRDNPTYRDVAALIARAREEMGTAAKQALEEATKLEAAGDLRGALAKYEQAAQVDPSMASIAEQLAGKVKARMKSEASDALTRAKQYDAVDRVADAITWYERAFNYLLDDDPNKKTVKARLDVLRARK